METLIFKKCFLSFHYFFNILILCSLQKNYYRLYAHTKPQYRLKKTGLRML